MVAVIGVNARVKIHLLSSEMANRIAAGATVDMPVLYYVDPKFADDINTKGKGIKVVIDVVEELGADGYLYGTAESAGEKIDVVVRVDGRDHAGVGDTVYITPKPEHVHVFDVESGKRLGDSRVVH